MLVLSGPSMISSCKLRVQMKLAGSKSFLIIFNNKVHLRHAPRYFLITPKLLPDLTYHRRMRILCVNNGEWLPDEQIGNLRSLVDNYVVYNKRG